MNFEESYEHASLRKTVAQVCAPLRRRLLPRASSPRTVAPTSFGALWARPDCSG